MELNLVEELEKYVKKEGNEVVVDWNSIRKLTSGREGSYNESLHEKILKHLQEMKILSVKQNHNYELTGCGLCLNPSLGNGIVNLYFTREQDAREYKRVNFNGSMYHVGIRRVEVVE